ncbi:MAG TPA: cytochrome c3 family protein [Bryobacteraceae bacterium]|nr:cytochrome c3 family protein [Bryobacteraceae bacterium]
MFSSRCVLASLLMAVTAAGSESIHVSDLATCGKCHSQARHVETSPMVRTLGPGSLLDAKKAWTATSHGYEYRIQNGMYEVRRGSDVIRVPVLWVFGSGRTGQTPLFELEGKLFESRVSLYKRKGGLDLTVGAANKAPATLLEAAGRQMSPADTKECFGCHSTRPASSASMRTGVGCVRCHQTKPDHPGASATAAKASAVSFESAGAQEISDLCGECHRTWEQVMLMKLRGVSTVRFQPYRLTQSKCYDPADKRISCVSCHDPHRPAEISTKRVDAACQSCHSAASAKPPCGHGPENCASCHMPKFELPGAHAEFSDHRIRVARKGEPFPD